MKDEKAIIPFLKLLAEESAKVINPLFANPGLKVELKDDDTPVTYADKKAEEVMRERIAREFPDHGIIGEEFGSDNADAEYTWILDPIDGTRSFAAGSPHFGTLICLQKNNLPIWGAIHLPAIGQLFIGDNEICLRNDHPTTLREPPPLKDCFLLTTDPKAPEVHQDGTGWKALLEATGQYRSWGDCFGYTLLASGGVDIMTDPILNLWDLAALIPVLRGAGAITTSWKGDDPFKAESLVACHPKIHADVIRLLNP
ncbi:histidinol-phosphatase [Puniceicoccales bacterium CK1056]|uniref:Histidinol-phosphatase n=1 Tax=Oceanipulchritudo coccoides TaxID=2706888 RepID=A0A6B2M3Z2_9BACT|nr:inositol monophosphatase family protein [Oceanipulchritudo coccoides]NDV63012.1 histidinol-phosphatase [Oceanipulchritudo coccoides]